VNTSTTLPVIVALNNIRSLHNVGAIFRSADAVKAEGILLAGLTPTPPRHEIEKTALGATKTVPWEYVANLSKRLREYQQAGYAVCALEQTPRSQSLFECTIPFPCVLVVGHEREGVEAEVLTLATHHFDLPMRGHSAHSLNVSTATTVALYECLRQHI